VPMGWNGERQWNWKGGKYRVDFHALGTIGAPRKRLEAIPSASGIDSQLEACRSVSKRVEQRPNTFFLTNLPFLYRIQVGWTTLVLRISSNLLNHTHNAKH